MMLKKESFNLVATKNSFLELGFGRIDGVIQTCFKIRFIGNGFVKFSTIQIALLKKYCGQIGGHKINSDQTTVVESGAFNF